MLVSTFDKDVCVVTRRDALKVCGAALLGAAISGAGLNRAIGMEGDIPLECEGDGLSFSALVSGLGTGAVTVGYTVTSTAQGCLVTGADVTLRPKDAGGYYLDDVALSLDFSAEPLAFGDTRQGFVTQTLDEAAASLECLGATAARRWPLLEVDGLQVYYMGEAQDTFAGSSALLSILEKRGKVPGGETGAGRDDAKELTFALAAEGGRALVSRLVLQMSVCGEDGREIGTPSLVVVDSPETPVELTDGPVTLSAQLAWRPDALDWVVTDVECDVVWLQDGDFELLVPGTLTVATSADYPPFESIVDDEFVGLDIDLISGIAEKLGLGAAFKNMAFDELIPAVAAGECDCAIAAFSSNPDRAQVVDFSTPYYSEYLAVVAMGGSALVGLSDDEIDAALNNGVDYSVAVQAGSLSEWTVGNNYPGAAVGSYVTTDECLEALRAGLCDVVVADSTVAQAAIRDVCPDAVIVKEIWTGEDYAIAVSKDNPGLTAAINTAVEELIANGMVESLIYSHLG